MIGFNKPHFTGHETDYIKDAVTREKISGDGFYTQKCHEFFENRYGFKKVLLTTSCTDALEMAAILLDIQPGDEVIAPSFTFVSTVNAFILRGAKIIFVDSCPNHPNMDELAIEKLITPKTKAIIPVHYAGVSCNMDVIMKIAKEHNLFVVEDAAQAIDGYYGDKPLGSIGHMAAFSFHETKNLISGEGGMLVINDERFTKRAEIIREKGTNRSAFFRGEVDKYGWVDVGSSFLPSDMIAAFLYAQLENIEDIQQKRKTIWQYYYSKLMPLQDTGKITLPIIHNYGTNNAHMFYVLCNSADERNNLLKWLKNENINAVFHYLSLHKSFFFKDKYDGPALVNSDHFSDCLVRLPFYYDLTFANQDLVVGSITRFFAKP